MATTPESEVILAESLGGDLPRWQLPDFDNIKAPPTAKQLEEIEAAAHKDGYERGYSEGFAVGQKAAVAQAQRLQALVEHMSRPLAQLDEEVESALVELASAVARRILRDELSVKPEHVQTLVRDVLAGLPPQLRHVRIAANAEDVALLRELVEAPPGVKEFEIVTDAQLKRGDCRVYTESSQVDATLEQRVRVAALALAGGE